MSAVPNHCLCNATHSAYSNLKKILGRRVEEEAPWSLRAALATLAISTAFIAWLSEILVGSVEESAAQIGMSKIFVGVIIVAVIGNAAEHSTAVIAAMRNRMDQGIAMGSRTQVALFVAPLLVFLSYAIGAAPMDLAFTMGETFAIMIAAMITAQVTSDGRSSWFTGALLLTLYLILAVGFSMLPLEERAAASIGGI